MPHAIYSEIEELWEECYADAQREPPGRSAFHDLCQQLRDENRHIGTERLQPWLGILEFGLEWLSYIHFALSNENEIGPRHDNCRAPWALVGASTAFGLSLRELCLSGFDTRARSLLRSYTESLFLCLATLDDKDLADRYANSEDDARIKDFWHTVASPKNLHVRINELERKYGFPEDLVKEMTDWRRTEYEVLSQSSHLSYLAACMTCLPAQLTDHETHQVGILGRASANSIRTVSYAARTTWYFSRLGFPMIVGKDKDDGGLLQVDKENDWHQRIVIGRDVLSRVTVANWDDQSL